MASSSHLATCRKTLKYFPEIFSENLAHVGLRPAGGITGRLDVRLTGSQAGGQIGQLGGSFTVRTPGTAQVGLVSTSSRGKFLVNSSKSAFLALFVAASSVLFLHPLILLLKAGDDVLPHLHDGNRGF